MWKLLASTTTTSTGTRRSARATVRPPKPAPTTTTRGRVAGASEATNTRYQLTSDDRAEGCLVGGGSGTPFDLRRPGLAGRRSDKTGGRRPHE